jgi:LysM repeat protein
MASIADSFQIYQPDLEAINQGNSSPVRPGTLIRLTPWNYGKCADPADAVPTCRVYSVKAGDFMFNIAQMFQVDTQELLAVNVPLTLDSTLAPGQRVKIPPHPEKCGFNVIEAEPPTTGVTTCRKYQVKAGDSLSSIALA